MGFGLGEMLVRRSASRSSAEHPRCAGCRRTPLHGELMRVFEGGRKLCALCAGGGARRAREPGEPLGLERVRPSPRHVRVTPRAA